MRPVLQGVLPEAHGGAKEAESAPRWMTKDVAEGGALRRRGCRSKARRACLVLLPATGNEACSSGGRDPWAEYTAQALCRGENPLTGFDNQDIDSVTLQEAR